jgi:hypothetical protein
MLPFLLTDFFRRLNAHGLQRFREGRPGLSIEANAEREVRLLAICTHYLKASRIEEGGSNAEIPNAGANFAFRFRMAIKQLAKLRCVWFGNGCPYLVAMQHGAKMLRCFSLGWKEKPANLDRFLCHASALSIRCLEA